MRLQPAIAVIILAATFGFAEIAALGRTTHTARTSVQLKATLTGHTRKILEVAFSPDGETVATGSEDGTVRLWNTHTGGLVATLNCAQKYRWHVSIVWSPNGQAIAVDGQGDEGPQIWNVRSAKIMAELATRSTYSMIWSADGSMLLTTRFADKVAKLWDGETGRQLAEFEQDPPCPDRSFLTRWINQEFCDGFTFVTAHFAAEGRSVITASSEQPAKLWDVSTGKLKTMLPLRGEQPWEKMYQSDVVMSPNRRLVARYIHNEVSLIDTSTGEVKHTLGQIGLPMAFSPDSQMLLTTIREPTAGKLGKWDEFKLYDLATGQLRLTFERVPLIYSREYLHWSSDGHTILVGSGDARLLDARTGKVKGVLKYRGCVSDNLIGDDGCQPVILSADGRIAVKVTNPVRLWSADDGTLVTTLDMAHAPARFSPTDRRLLITRSKDKKTALLWEVTVS